MKKLLSYTCSWQKCTSYCRFIKYLQLQLTCQRQQVFPDSIYIYIYAEAVGLDNFRRSFLRKRDGFFPDWPWKTTGMTLESLVSLVLLWGDHKFDRSRSWKDFPDRKISPAGTAKKEPYKEKNNRQLSKLRRGPAESLARNEEGKHAQNGNLSKGPFTRAGLARLVLGNWSSFWVMSGCALPISWYRYPMNKRTGGSMWTYIYIANVWIERKR